MKIQDRMNALDGVADTHWDSQRGRLVVYYSATTPKDTIKVRVAGAIGEAHLQRAVEEITLISINPN